MLEDKDIRSFFDISITHFPDRSARWLLQHIEYVQGLLEIVAPLVKLVGQHTQELEVETMAKSMADVLRKQGIEQGIEQGETRAKQAAVLKLLQFRFNDVPEAVANQVTLIRNLSRLDSLFEEVWEATTLDEIDWLDLNNQKVEDVP